MGNTFTAVPVYNKTGVSINVVAETPGTTTIISTVQLLLGQNNTLSLANGSNYTVYATTSSATSTGVNVVLNGPNPTIQVTLGPNAVPVVTVTYS